MHGGRTMGKYSEVFVAFDVAKKKHAVAIAEGGRTGEVRFMGNVENNPAPIERTIKRLATRYARLHVCFEAGPTGYGLYRQVQALGHDCMVVAPALIPKRAGERIKTNRRDAVTLARLHRAGELTGVWTPDAAHEAVRDLVRAREAAADDLRRKRQQLLSFLLRHSRISKKPLRRDRPTPDPPVKRRKPRVELSQSRVRQPPHRPQRMPRRDARLDVDIREQGPARPILAPHRPPRIASPHRLADATESRRKPKFQSLSAQLLQQPVNFTVS